ncbi:modification methylase [Dolosigranulum pigrum]|uniref:DNA methyltransferase n=1 Tax=Dolosigranulum pigrum TaxID=29394 RepID=UPI000DBF852C|nr:DNA methyltransferase [Dolosigranulum pigrum]RAN56428.1 modification methylase [Dolosigranulum pigrum]
MSKEVVKKIYVKSLPEDIISGDSYVIEQPNPNSYTHSFFKYPCKFIPEIPRWAIKRYLSQSDQIIFDPFAGSGTSILEGIIQNHDSYGTEIDDVAKLIIKTKTTQFSDEQILTLEDSFNKLIGNLNIKLEESDYPQINNLYHWFSKDTVETLAKIRKNINIIKDENIRDFMNIVFASIIKRTSYADDFSPKPYVSTKIIKNPPNPIDEFKRVYEKYLLLLKEFNSLDIKNSAKIIQGDALNFKLDKRIDLAITSPPYINAFDYGRTMRLENIWLNTITEDELRDKKKNYVGTESINVKEESENLEILKDSKLLFSYYEKIKNVDLRRANVMKKFFEDMKINLSLVYDNLKTGGKYVIVIGDSNIRKVKIESWKILLEIAENIGFKQENYFNYLIQNPYIRIPRQNKGGKIKVDHVIVLEKGE